MGISGEIEAVAGNFADQSSQCIQVRARPDAIRDVIDRAQSELQHHLPNEDTVRVLTLDQILDQLTALSGEIGREQIERIWVDHALAALGLLKQLARR